MSILKNELSNLIYDYNKCDNSSIKEQILSDINLLRQALTILQKDEQKIDNQNSKFDY
jgi:hypothetical protein